MHRLLGELILGGQGAICFGISYNISLGFVLCSYETSAVQTVTIVDGAQEPVRVDFKLQPSGTVEGIF